MRQGRKRQEKELVMRFIKVMDYNTRIRTLLNIDVISALQETPGGYYTIITSATTPLLLDRNDGKQVMDMLGLSF